jgi:hypothetical protein
VLWELDVRTAVAFASTCSRLVPRDGEFAHSKPTILARVAWDAFIISRD